METNYIVYRDKEYTTSWISHELADEIANYLTGYLFSWDNVPGDGSEEERLLRYLKDDHNIVWAENVEIRKSDDNIIIQIEDENLSATITLVDDEVKATLKINGDWKCNLKVKKEDDKLNIYLKGKGFKVLGANELGKWMKAVIRNEDTKNTVVVFAQDVAPDTVFEDIGTKPLIDNMGATVLIRQYLDFGGRVVWIGDMPFSYQGKNGAKDPEELMKKHETTYPYQTDLRGASINVLSVIPIFLYAPRRPVEITKRGREWGLETVWSSLRPIVIDKKTMELTKYFAKTEGLIASLSIKYKKMGSLNWLKRNFRRIKSFSIGVGEVSIEADIGEDDIGEDKDKISKIPPLECYEEYASAWFKNFNKEEQNSGFVRIWDFSPRVITKAMKNELLQVATHIINIKKKASTGARLGSYIIDSIIVGIFGLILSFALCAAFGDLSDVYVPIASLLGLLLIHLVYFTCLFRNGQTFGMKYVGIKLYRIDETDTIGYAKGFLRGIGMIISGLVICLGYLWILIDENERGWHDKIAGTYVGEE